MSTITILHLSDIHFKPRGLETEKTFRRHVSEKMMEAIKEHLAVNPAPDVAAVTGDIAYSGKEEEYQEAGEFFYNLKELLPPTVLYLVVPGNHDVDRAEISEFFSLHAIVETQKIDRFLENKKELNKNINPKFKAFRGFVDDFTPGLYQSKEDYFWVKDVRDKGVSFLGLNSCWACEDDRDKDNITLGYPQVMDAFRQAKMPGCILLMHHPPKWLNEIDFDRYEGEIFKRCDLILHGHTHADNALVFKSPTASCICLGANASYTDEKKYGFIGFQFIRVEFHREGAAVKVWPYRLETRDTLRFVKDYHRWESQKGRDCFEIDSIKPTITPKDIIETSPVKSPKNFEMKICSDASMDYIDQEIIKEITKQMDKRRWIEVFGSKFSPNIDVFSFLKKTKLVAGDSLTNAVVLLYGKFPQELPNLKDSSIFCTRFKGTSVNDDVLDETIVNGNISNQIDSSIDFIKKNIRKGWSLKDKAKRDETYEYPIMALREAVANAVAHRNYELEATCQIRIFDDRIEIWSPGNLVDKISVEDLYKDHNSFPRNPYIALHLYASLFLEKRGFGTIKIVESMRKAGLADPQFENDGNNFVVRLYGPGDKFLEKKDVKPLVIPKDYFEWVKEFHSTMDIDLLAHKGEAITVNLPEVFITIETANPFYKEEQKRKKQASDEKLLLESMEESESEESASIDIEALVGRKHRLLLRGGAGTGKTTLIKHLAYTVTSASCYPALNGYLPVMLFLKDLWPIYSEEMKTKKKVAFEDLLTQYLEKSKYPLTIDTINNYLAHHKVLFLIDGLDEVPEHLRPDLVEMIAHFQFENKENRFLLTGRPHGIAGRAESRFGSDLHDIEPLNDRMVKDFIKKWFRAVSGRAKGLGDVTAESMISDIHQHEHISMFTQNPLLLTAVCILYQDGKRIPEQRADLYNRIVDNLINRRFHDPVHPGKENEILEFLMHLAFTTHQKNRKTIEISDALASLRNIFKHRENERETQYELRIANLFNEIEPNCGLFNRLSSGEFEFTHLTFQEFLAAKHMVYMGTDWKRFLEQKWWEEALLLYSGFMSLDRKRDSNAMVETILELGEKKKKNRNSLQLLAGRALCDFQSSKREPQVVSRVRETLYSMIESTATVEDRFQAGEIVGGLGDTRIRPDHMTLIPAGEFIRGSNEIGKEEKPERLIYLDAFEIGIYPVTNQKFKRFVEDKGYHMKEYWTPEGWEWRNKENITEPRFWHDRQWNGANFPVVGISWYEAVAYANWLSQVTGKNYRLPTEAEWEKAARGTGGREYPWGNGFDKNLCNSDESRLGRTSPVGIYPGGQSPFSCFDMAGNVWEWCADWYDAEYYKTSPAENPKGPENGSKRVLRGGSWNTNADNCASAVRNKDYPTFRWDREGFRLARSL